MEQCEVRSDPRVRHSLGAGSSLDADTTVADVTGRWPVVFWSPATDKTVAATHTRKAPVAKPVVPRTCYVSASSSDMPCFHTLALPPAPTFINTRSGRRGRFVVSPFGRDPSRQTSRWRVTEMRILFVDSDIGHLWYVVPRNIAILISRSSRPLCIRTDRRKPSSLRGTDRHFVCSCSARSPAVGRSRTRPGPDVVDVQVR